MRSHGDPNQVDPTIDANKVIHITFPADASGNGPVGLGKGSNDPCSAYLTAASTALRGGKPLPKPDPAKLEKFSQCMRAHGIPDFPDPSGGGLQLHSSPGSDLNPNNPTFKNASKLCAKKYGLPGLGGGTPQPGSIEATAGSGTAGRPGSEMAGRAPRSGVRSAVAEFSARRVVAVAALAGVLVGGAVAGGVAAASASGNHDATASSSGGSSGTVATAAVVRTDLATTVQVGGSIGYDGSYTVIIPSGASAQQVAQAQQQLTQAQQALANDETMNSYGATADGQALTNAQNNLNAANADPERR